MGTIIRIISAENFNFLSDLVGLAISEMLFFAIGYSYSTLMSWHLKTGKFIPFNNLIFISGKPQQLISALRHKDFRSWVIYLLAFLVVIAQFSHPFSDLTLKFTQETISSNKNEAILDLRKKNENFLYQVVGDPYNLRTAAYIRNKNHVEVTASFMTAVDNIAQGTSPFVTDGFEFENVIDGKLGGVDVLYLRSQEDSVRPIASIPEEIPLNNCSDAMINVEQYSSHRFATEAFVPSCTFSTARESGIHKASKNNITITDYAQISGLDSELYGDIDRVAVLLGDYSYSGNDDYTIDFEIPRAYRLLARDTVNWKTGRDVSELIFGLKIGSEQIEFESTVIASVAAAWTERFSYYGDDDNYTDSVELASYHEYIFVSKVADGRCPPKPSGAASEKETSCIVTFTAFCEPFAEDTLPYPPDTVGSPDESWCEYVVKADIVWGRNFEVDAEFIAAVAGIYSRNKLLEHRSVSAANSGSFEEGLLYSGPFSQKVLWNSVLAAKFAFGMLGKMESTKVVVRAEIGADWIVLTLLPIIIGCLLMIITLFVNMKSCNGKEEGITLHVPVAPWELMVVGKEDEDIIPIRDNCTEPFPKKPKGLQYGVVNDVELRLISKPKPDEDLAAVAVVEDEMERTEEPYEPIPYAEDTTEEPDISVAQEAIVVKVTSTSAAEEIADALPPPPVNSRMMDAENLSNHVDHEQSLFDDIAEEIKTHEMPAEGESTEDIDLR